MFNIVENNIIKDFSCRYEDEYHNRIRLARKGQGFYAKLKFSNDKVSVPVIRVQFPVEENEKGLRIVLNFADGKDHSGDEDVVCAVEGTAKLINHWIMMLTDIIRLEFTPALNDVPPEALAKVKFDTLKGYEELSDVISAAENR